MSKLPDAIGRVYSGMTVLERRGHDGRRFRRYLVRCHCGRECELSMSGLRQGRAKSCGCIGEARAAARDISGKRFGRLVAIRRTKASRDRHWLARCDCGAEVSVAYYALKTGSTRSCGCAGPSVSTKHGHLKGGKRSPEYVSWKAMINRCSDPTQSNWKNYGGRGIRVCSRWRGSFVNFLADMGPRPPGKELDRIDNDGDYEPGNVRWATRKENMRNRRSTRVLEFRGQRRTLAECAELSGVSRWLMYDRLRRGWSAERAVSQPPHVPGRPKSTA